MVLSRMFILAFERVFLQTGACVYCSAAENFLSSSFECRYSKTLVA